MTIRDVDDVLKLFRIEEETGQEAADSGLIHQRPHIFLGERLAEMERCRLVGKEGRAYVCFSVSASRQYGR